MDKVKRGVKMKIGPWVCDECQNEILKSDDGYVLYEKDKNSLAHNFRIIHKIKCDKSPDSLSMALSNFLGTQGLVYLTSFLSIGPISKQFGDNSSAGVKDFDEFVDFFRRVQIPFYEQARMKFSPHLFNENNLEPSGILDYMPKNLERISKLGQE